jgi:diguanylate cyclase
MDHSLHGSDELDQLRGELQQARRERDALAARVRELEQQIVAPGPDPAAQTSSVSFEDCFRTEQSRAKRLRIPLSLALVEIDDLQDLRDRLGHAAGEDALARLGKTIEDSLRPTDVVSRIDGLAYGVLLTGTNIEQALAALVRLQQDVADAPYMTGHVRSTLTFSAGVVQWRNDEALGDLLTRASRALGLARRGGPGKVVVG